MKTWIIVRKEDLKIMGSYEAAQKDDSSANRSYLAAEPICAHVEMPEGLDKDCLVASVSTEKWVKDGEADITDAGSLPLDWQIEGWTHVPSQHVVSESQDLLDEKAQQARNAKLVVLRSLRDQKIEHADNERKKHEDSDPNAISTAQAWSDYRIALRDITDSYKDENDGSLGTDALDAYADDMSDFDSWPVEPS